MDGEGKDVRITLSKNVLKGVEDTVEVTVENARAPKSDWIGLYEVNEVPSTISAIWWMYTNPTNGTVKFTHKESSSSSFKEVQLIRKESCQAMITLHLNIP